MMLTCHITECSTYEVTQSPVAGTIISDTTTVTITVTDEYGNTAPVHFRGKHHRQHRPGDQHLRSRYAGDPGCRLQVIPYLTYTVDADLNITECSTYEVTQSPAAGTIISDTTTVTITVTDEYGNTTSCNFEVNTIDNTNPVINTCAADTLVTLDAACKLHAYLTSPMMRTSTSPSAAPMRLHRVRLQERSSATPPR